MQYSKFEIEGEPKKFEIKKIEYYNGENVDERMIRLNGMQFSTSYNCNESINEGWWHGACDSERVNLNGLYPDSEWQGHKFMQWKPWNTAERYVVYSEVKIRKND